MRLPRGTLLGVAAAGVVVARHRREMALPRPASALVAAGVPVVVAAALPPGRLRAAGTWLAHMWAYKIEFEIPYDEPERLRARLHVAGPVHADERLGGGVAPSQRLQRRFHRRGRIGALDVLVTGVYALWEAEPHLVLAWILLRHPERFAASADRLGATFDLTLLGYWTWPSAPPWWASELAGYLDREVVRVVPRVGRRLRGEPLDQDDVHGANPWAAMPSDHFASALMAARVAAAADRRVGAAALAYALALGGALVYLGEHYVVDLIAGAGLAGAVEGAAAALGRATG